MLSLSRVDSVITITTKYAVLSSAKTTSTMFVNGFAFASRDFGYAQYAIENTIPTTSTRKRATPSKYKEAKVDMPPSTASAM